jgi:hypothetical protein
MAMGTRKQREKQEDIWIAHTELASAPGHPFYQRLNELLEAESFDEFVEQRCARFYAAKYGRPSLMPGIYFRALLIGYFEGIGAERGIAWRLRTKTETLDYFLLSSASRKLFHQLSKSSSNGVLKFACRAIPPNSNRLRRNSFVGRAVETPKFLDTCPSLGLSSQQGLPNVCACYEGLLYILRLQCRNFYDRLAILDNVIVHQARIIVSRRLRQQVPFHDCHDALCIRCERAQLEVVFPVRKRVDDKEHVCHTNGRMFGINETQHDLVWYQKRRHSHLL